jgi:L-cysteine S-thiosulfotransferase
MRLARSSLLAAILAAAPASAQEIGALDLFVRPDKGHCIACHQLPQGKGPETRADVGPRLEGARMRELGPAALREILADATTRNPDTLMPPYGRHRILAAPEIARLAEFLHALP